MSDRRPNIQKIPPNSPQQRDRYYRLYELFHSITSTLDTTKALNLIIDAAVQITGATGGSLILVDKQAGILHIKVSRGFLQHIEDTKLKIGEGITGWVAQTGTPLRVPDVSKEPRYVQINADIQSELAVPLSIGEELIGVVNVDSTRLNAFSEEDLDLLNLLSKQSAQVIRNGELFDTVKRTAEELSTLIKINKTIANTLSLEKILPQIVERTATLMQSPLCSIWLLSEDQGSLRLAAQYGEKKVETPELSIRVAEHTLGTVIHTQQPLHLADIHQIPNFNFHDMPGKAQVRSMLAVPLIALNKVIGLIKIYKAEIYQFTEDEKRLLMTFADLCAIAIENARLYETTVTLEEQTRRAERLAAVGELAVGLAHEIRNPLTIVKMLFDAESELTRRDREIIREELNRMNHIITHLLDYARPKEPVREPCNIRKLLENMLLLLNHKFEKKKIRVDFLLPEHLPGISADPLQLQQVFLNLLLNAGDALPQGGIISISGCYKTDGESPYIEMTIQDNGTGIPENLQEQLFKPFTTNKPKGLGLGLSIVKRIIDGHYGKITMESELNKGTRVKIRLPV